MKKLLLLSALFIFACTTDSEGNPCIYEPTLETNAVTDITETSATLNGVISIVSENCEVPNNTEQGFVYSTEIQPTLEDTQVNVNGTNISTTIDGLEPNTTYFVRAFLTNNLGDFYGDEVSFTTDELNLTPPVITIIGDNPLEINIGEDYIEYGATATDDIDGNITQDIIIDSSNLNTTLVGNYTVTYSVSDSSNNSTTEQREVIVFDNSLLFNCDGNPVPTIVYGTQEWTVENACNITYRDGTPIPEVTDASEWANLTTGAWCYYENDPTKPRLYNYYALMGIHDNDETTPNKEFAPEGWHIPLVEEWLTLESYLVENGYNYDGTNTTTPANKLAKSMASNSGWISLSDIFGQPDDPGAPANNQNTNNSSGFNAFPVGIRLEDGYFSFTGGIASEGIRADFWLSSVGSPFGSSNIYCVLIGSGSESAALASYEETEGSSVRFIKD
jgi:uncharacterized protein (TIGR02145 family)